MDKKSLQVSKAMMVHCLLVKKFNAEAGIAFVAATPSRPERTIHVHFRLINCIFSVICLDQLNKQTTWIILPWIVLWLVITVLEDDESVAKSMTSADKNDVFGVEEGGFCCFTNSIVIIYLRLWLHEQPGLTGFVSQHTPDEFQVDTMVAPAATATAK